MSCASLLQWISSQHDRMCRLVSEWAAINSGTRNLPGLARMSDALANEFSSVGVAAPIELPPEQIIDSRGNIASLQLGKALLVRGRPTGPLRVFLGIHMDTVYGAEDPFQSVEQVDSNSLRGPGVADAKGGIVVILIALEALSRSEFADRIRWEVLLNPDEEIGSPGSAPLLAECAGRNDLGLVFEPALADGTMVNTRKGSGNFSVVIRGRSAHAGRDFSLGRNAIHAAADFVEAASMINGAFPDVTINVGRIDGGGPVNVVPDLAIVRLNARVAKPGDQQLIEKRLRIIAQDVAERHEVTAQVHGEFRSPPWKPGDRSRILFDALEDCGRELGIPIHWTSSGGASDANKLAACGLPVIDTMGPRGGNLHSAQEFLLLDSLVERAQLTALFLRKLAAGKIPPRRKGLRNE